MAEHVQKPTLDKVEIHPLVLLSVTDHYNRVAKDTKKRVVGCLLGAKRGDLVSVSNSFAVPFDEEDKPPATWFLDYNYLEDMAHMFKRVNANERIVGWYSTGPKLKSNDIDVQKLFFEYCTDPVLVIIEVKEVTEDIPTQAYVAVDVVRGDGTHEKEFAHVKSSIVASEAEEVGVEHLLREIQDISLSTLTTEVKRKQTGLNGLAERLSSIRDYLQDVVSGKLPINQDILRNLQLILNLLPNLSKPTLIDGFTSKKNDIMLHIYISSLLRSILALDQLLDNKLYNKRTEEEREDAAIKKEREKREKQKQKEKEKEKEKEEKEKEKKAKQEEAGQEPMDVDK